MRRRGIPRGDGGLSLTELIVVTFILVILSGLLFETYRFQSQLFRKELDRAATEGNLRIWASRMMRDIRNAGYDPLGSTFTMSVLPVQVATDTDFEFKTDANASGGITLTDPHEYLGYRRSGSSLELRQGSSSTWRTVVTGVTSLTFTYWDVNGNQVNQTSPYTAYGDIALVKFAITAQATDASTSFTESGMARIRNPG